MAFLSARLIPSSFHGDFFVKGLLTWSKPLPPYSTFHCFRRYRVTVHLFEENIFSICPPSVFTDKKLQFLYLNSRLSNSTIADILQTVSQQGSFRLSHWQEGKCQISSPCGIIFFKTYLVFVRGLGTRINEAPREEQKSATPTTFLW